ncbi:MAG: Dodecaprenyl-phosphate galacturonate synthase [Phycisphaerae bacterium]|nr:Dodecaprenyl-phosphate galacturonate synthase [Phycisphaerae bacterium]
MANRYLRTLDLSVVVPIYNEEDNIPNLCDKLLAALRPQKRTFEVILVNDGSRDNSARTLDAAAAQHAEIRVIHFARNCGQTLAIAAGMDEARGAIIVTLDGDLQNDPADITHLLDHMDEGGFACVSGWRKNRQDGGLRRWVSQVANRIINSLARVPIHDLGCTLKAYRADAINPRELFGEMHRFLPLYVQARGGSVGELVVHHHPRTAGVSKYGFGRIPRVISDIFLVSLLLRYRTRPSHAFAKFAQYLVIAAVIIMLWGVVARIIWSWPLISALIPMLILLVGAANLVAVGLACELIIRNRYQIADQPPWEIARRVNFD